MIDNSSHKPTIRHIAIEAGVSIGTVSNYLNATACVSKETAERIQAAIDKVGYQPNLNARSLRSQSTKTFGLVLPDLTNPFFAEIATTIEAYAWEAGFQVILCSSSNSEREAAKLQTLYQRRIDGALVIHAGALLRAITDKWSVPTVFLDRHAEGQYSIVTDNVLGGQLAIEHLADLGHEQISIIVGGAHITNIQQRIRGAQIILDQRGITVPESYWIYGEQSVATGLLTDRFWQLDSPPTAIFATNDIIAIGVWHSCLGHNVRVPDDVSIVGFDNIMWSSLTVPPLTTVAQPTRIICEKAIEALMETIDGKPLNSTIVEVPPELIIRQSTSRLCPVA